MFCDELKLKVIAGKGGDGCVSFRREKFIPRGGPDGGDGGNGGNIVIKVNSQLNTLSHLSRIKTYRAEDGINGKGKKMYGKNAENLILEVPVGTLIYNSDKTECLADLSHENQEFIMAKGGKGGRGNFHFVSSIHQAPKFAEKGEPGEEKEIVIELKLVADVGIIGLPSAGKSTLISKISNAKPKIADYPFTTLIPNLGVVNMSQFGGSLKDSFVIADIPGLIEGASEGKGLGHQFLKHTSRTKILVHLVDATLDDIKDAIKVINKELKKYDPVLAKKEQIIAINKADMVDKETLKKTIKALKIKKVFILSALTGDGLKELIFEILEKVKEERNISIVEKKSAEIPILRPHLEKAPFEIEKIIKKKNRKVFRLVGKKLERMISMTDLNNPEGLERIYSYLEKSGIKKAVEKKGATFGDILRVKENDIPYRK